MLSVHGASRPRGMAANTRSPRPHPSNQPDIHVPRSFTARRTSMTACRPHRGALLHAASTSLLPHCFQPATASSAAAPSAAATARLLPHTAAAALPHARPALADAHRWHFRCSPAAATHANATHADATHAAPATPAMWPHARTLLPGSCLCCLVAIIKAACIHVALRRTMRSRAECVAW